MNKQTPQGDNRRYDAVKEFYEVRMLAENQYRLDQVHLRHLTESAITKTLMELVLDCPQTLAQRLAPAIQPMLDESVQRTARHEEELREAIVRRWPDHEARNRGIKTGSKNLPSPDPGPDLRQVTEQYAATFANGATPQRDSQDQKLSTLAAAIATGASLKALWTEAAEHVIDGTLAPPGLPAYGECDRELTRRMPDAEHVRQIIQEDQDHTRTMAEPAEQALQLARRTEELLHWRDSLDH